MTTEHSLDWVYEGLDRPCRRRLSDKIVNAFHACDEGALEIAGRLLDILAMHIKHPTRLPTGEDRRRPVSLLAVLNERLWRLRYPSPWNTNADRAW